MKQLNRIIDHCRIHKGITSKEAADLYGIQRLASRISDLKELGFQVDKVRESGINKFGEKVHYIRYFVKVD